MLGFGKKKNQADAAPPAPPSLDLRREGADFSDITTPEEVEAAVASGRLERFYMLSPQFGGPEDPMNMLTGPPGVVEARDWMDDQISAVLQRGGQVSADVQIGNDDGGSRVPRSVTYGLGDAGTHTLLFW